MEIVLFFVVAAVFFVWIAVSNSKKTPTAKTTDNGTPEEVVAPLVALGEPPATVVVPAPVAEPTKKAPAVKTAKPKKAAAPKKPVAAKKAAPAKKPAATKKPAK